MLSFCCEVFAVKIADLFGAALDAKITEDTAYVAYGAITVKVAFADIGDLVSKIKSFINEIGAAKSEGRRRRYATPR